MSQRHGGQLERAESCLEEPSGEFARQLLRRLVLDRTFRRILFGGWCFGERHG
ncbi:MAG TPA: hypothetical protein VIJ00_05335 [Nakamurella sp.]